MLAEARAAAMDSSHVPADKVRCLWLVSSTTAGTWRHLASSQCFTDAEFEAIWREWDPLYLWETFGLDYLPSVGRCAIDNVGADELGRRATAWIEEWERLALAGDVTDRSVLAMLEAADALEGCLP